MTIDSVQIECFLAVVQYMNFSKAAAALFISQPVLSRRISKLEEELGVQLFDRSKRNLVLTEAGTMLHTFFFEKRAEFQDVMETINQTQGKTRCIRVGICEGLDLSPYLREIAAEFPLARENVRLVFDSGPVENMLESFKTGDYDVLMMLGVTIDAYLKGGIVKKTLARDFILVNQCVVYSAQNPLSGKENLSLEDFKDQTLLCLKKEHIPQKVLTRSSIFERYGFMPKCRFLSSMDAVTLGLQMGEGFAVLDNHERILSTEDILYFELEDQQSIALVYKENPPAHLKAFLDFCCEAGVKTMS